jgi:hypothetical protein
MFFFDPLEQFSIFKILKGCPSVYNLDNISFMSLLNLLVVVILFLVPWYYSNLRN